MKLLIGKVTILRDRYSLENVKLTDKFCADLINGANSNRYTISNKCIPFTKYEKVFYEDTEHIVLSDIPYLLNEEYVVELNNKKIVNIELLKEQSKKHNKRIKIDINDGDFCYFTFNEKNLLEYRGHCPKTLNPLINDYFKNEQREDTKQILSSLIYDNEKFKERQLSVENRVPKQSVQND